MQVGLTRLALVLAGLVLIVAGGAIPAATADFDLTRLKEGGYVVLLRHVKAGGSDADDFDLRNCRTQRQVGAPGRKQAAELAARFRAAGIARARVVSSQFCRALQTAELLGLGPVTEAPGLNYFHWRIGDEAAMMRALRAFLADLEPGTPEAPTILVTHSHAFKEIGAAGVKSGGGVVVTPNGTAQPTIMGAITPP